MKFFITFLFLGSNILLFGQQISGTVFETNSDIRIEYVNIGIVGKNIGTVSSQNGEYTLQINSDNHNDTLRFSCIGYHPFSIKVFDFINMNNGTVELEKRLYDIAEIVVHPKKIKQKTLGISKKGRAVVACFSDSVRGGEIGVLMKNQNKAFIKEVKVNISNCSYDTIFYRVNIYEAIGNMQFENILSNPIYIETSKEEIKDIITINLRHLNLMIEGDFLVTFEHVKDLGAGNLCFSASLFNKSYGRETSQGTWETVPIGISIAVEVDIER